MHYIFTPQQSQLLVLLLLLL